MANHQEIMNDIMLTKADIEYISSQYDITAAIPNGVYLTRKREGLCKYHNIAHSDTNANLLIEDSGVYFICLASPKDKHLLHTLIDNGNDVEQYSSQYVKLLDLKYKTQWVCSPKGTGKTTMIMNIIKNHWRQKKILYLLDKRKSIIDTLSKMKNITLMPFNLGINEPLCIANVNMISEKMGMYDIIIIDDSCAVFHQICNMKTEIYDDSIERTFADRIREAEYVICLDADINGSYRKFLTDIRKNIRLHKIINDFETYPQRTANMIQYKQWLKSLQSALYHKKTVAIVASDDFTASNLERILNLKQYGKSYLFIGSNTRDVPLLHSLQDFNKHFKHIKVLMYTIPLTINRSFDKMYVYTHPNGVPATDIVQMIEGIKELNDKSIDIYARPSDIIDLPVTGEDIRNNILNELNSGTDRCDMDDIDLIDRLEPYLFQNIQGNYEWLFLNDPWGILITDEIANANMSKTGMNILLRKLLIYQGYKLTGINHC